MRYLKKLFFIPVFLILLLSLSSLQDSNKWVAPESADQMVNPLESNEANIEKAQANYKRLCRSCHGKLGDGQGVEAETLETVVTDFTIPSFVEQTDGSIHWKIAEGRNEMESFKDKLSEEEIWQLVLYIKTFSTE